MMSETLPSSRPLRRQGSAWVVVVVGGQAGRQIGRRRRGRKEDVESRLNNCLFFLLALFGILLSSLFYPAAEWFAPRPPSQPLCKGCPLSHRPDGDVSHLAGTYSGHLRGHTRKCASPPA